VLDSILAVSDTEETPIQDLAVEGVDIASVADVVAKQSGRHNAEAALEDDEEDDEGEDNEITQKARAKAEKDAETTAALLGKFVDVVDLLPPLPKKGMFDVQDIKNSKYFFS
jgi:DNA-directed RNA polymerase, mitochondrial